MSKLREKWTAKVAAGVIFVLAVLLALSSCLGILFLENYRGYDDPTGDLAEQLLLEQYTRNRIAQVERQYHSIKQGQSDITFSHYFDADNTNFFFQLCDKQETVLLENYWSKDARYTFEESLYFVWDTEEITTYPGEIFTWDVDNWNKEKGVYEYRDDSGKLRYTYDEQGGLWDAAAQNWGNWEFDGSSTTVRVWVTETEELTIRGGVTETLHAEDELAMRLALCDILLPLRHGLIAVAILAGLLMLGSLFFLLWAVGHREGVEGIYLALWHRLPLDLAAGLVLAAAIVGLVGLDYLPWQTTDFDAVLLTLAVLILLALLLLALYSILTLTVRLKAGKWWRNTILYRLLYWCWKWAARCLRGIPLVWKTAVICAAIAMAELFVMFVFGYGVSDGEFFLWLVEQAVLIPLLLYAAWQMRLLKKSGEALAAGDLSVRTDTSKLVLDFKQHGESLNRIGDGMNAAVDARLRSERLKTELITNVSHDLKTPLTSIVNYVDLMEQLPGLQPEAAKDYLAVLRRQSDRLKKLTEDLVEASKASSGVMPVNLAPVNLHELLRQAVGEYEQKLAEAELQLMLELPPHCTVQADGRLLWRVLDNLLNNCCKYAMPGTRVYLQVTTGQSRAAIFVKNISREILNTDPDALMERFVRADPSRSTEGSGLGLSIARSLTELQQGSFGLQIDGDLFKVELSLPLEKAISYEE